MMNKQSQTQSDYQIEMLHAANRKPIYVTGGDPLAKAVTLMLANNFSQLPVFNNNSLTKPLGFISWKTIGEKFVGNSMFDRKMDANLKVSEFIQKDIVVLSKNETLFYAINQIAKHDFLLVHDGTSKQEIVGIITTNDLTEQFEKLAKPFLLMSEIENNIRKLLNMAHLTQEKLATAKITTDKRIITTVDDLSFSEYITVIAKFWDELTITWLDKSIFIEKLEKIRELRNHIMHFNPNGLNNEDIQILDKFSNFLKNISN